ncbi:hypothetical protein [Paraburkholderia sp. DGU8]|uniref:hypothetical protein n=1 Tax=Paraburkholderia sp. DGU8 TaxID=3161997 RepID=UPI0034670801
MAFKIAQSDTYQQEINVQIVGETGKVEKHNFKVTFERCSNDRIEELRSKSGREMLLEVVKGWSGVIDDDGAAVPFNDDNLEGMMQIPAASFALIKGFWDSIVVAREKN